MGTGFGRRLGFGFLSLQRGFRLHVLFILEARRNATLQGENYIECIGLQFDVIPGGVLHLEHLAEHTYEEIIHYKIKKSFDKIAENQFKNLHSECDLITQYMPLDCKGDVYLCCAVLNDKFYYIANYIDTDLQDIQKLREKYPYCAFCLKPRTRVEDTASQ